MADLTRDDLAAFVALWPKVFVPMGLVTESTLKVLQTVRDLAQDGGTLTIPAHDRRFIWWMRSK